MSVERVGEAGETLPLGKPAGKKIRGTFLLPGELLDELRDASYWARLSLARIAERALSAELARLRAEHNGGERFSRRPAA
ncbi:MAG: hypothetical protein DCC68_21890 [Planctomycetota bacterium]|nr:MAG: hypothetical protein DCC68_21890 [Planctomycetota bacterium]